MQFQRKSDTDICSIGIHEDEISQFTGLKWKMPINNKIANKLDSTTCSLRIMSKYVT